jgi:hypothetical protein
MRLPNVSFAMSLAHWRVGVRFGLPLVSPLRLHGTSTSAVSRMRRLPHWARLLAWRNPARTTSSLSRRELARQ